MTNAELLKAFIEYCNKHGYGSAWHQESLIEPFLEQYAEHMPQCNDSYYLGPNGQEVPVEQEKGAGK